MDNPVTQDLFGAPMGDIETIEITMTSPLKGDGWDIHLRVEVVMRKAPMLIWIRLYDNEQFAPILGRICQLQNRAIYVTGGQMQGHLAEFVRWMSKAGYDFDFKGIGQVRPW